MKADDGLVFMLQCRAMTLGRGVIEKRRKDVLKSWHGGERPASVSAARIRSRQSLLRRNPKMKERKT